LWAASISTAVEIAQVLTWTATKDSAEIARVALTVYMEFDGLAQQSPPCETVMNVVRSDL
jgi:hypothetical protein